MDQFLAQKVSRKPGGWFWLRHQGVLVGRMVGDGRIVGVPVPPGVGDTDGVTDGAVPEPVGDGMAVLVGVGDTRSAVKNAGDVRLQVVPFGAVKLIWTSTI